MDIAVEVIRFPAAVHALGRVDLTADQLGMAPAAFAAAAVGRSRNAGCLQIGRASCRERVLFLV